jgi:hypothetical protein
MASIYKMGTTKATAKTLEKKNHSTRVLIKVFGQ